MIETAAILGATGLIGSRLLELLVHDETFTRIRVISRRPLSLKDPKIDVSVIDFADQVAFRNALEGCSAVFCAVGTTQKKVKGDNSAYRKVDFDIPVNAARICAETGSRHFLLISSVGANSSSGNFYLKLKGEVEETVKQFNIPSISIFQPSMLLGKREERRPAERIVSVIIKPLSFLFPAKYKPVEASCVASSMLSAYLQDKPGVQVYQYNDIMGLCRNIP
jgi:uncharacterized protein YbjT (DUF2867 family)